MIFNDAGQGFPLERQYIPSSAYAGLPGHPRGYFALTGTHVYQNDGPETIKVTITDEDGSTIKITDNVNVSTNINLEMLGLTSTLKNQDITNELVPPPDGTPPFTANTGETPPFAPGTYNPNYIELPLATFSADPGVAPDDYTGIINWGDGSSSAAIIRCVDVTTAPAAALVHNTMAVCYPSKIYNAGGQYGVTVTIHGKNGYALGTSKVFEETILGG